MRVRIRPKADPLAVLVTLLAAPLGAASCSDPGDVSVSRSDDPRSGGRSGFDVRRPNGSAEPSPPTTSSQN